MTTIYCPKCASQAVEGQRYCRTCGTNLGLILDAMEGKRTPIDFDSLIEDMGQLGSSLRSSFEEARANFKKTKTRRFSSPATSSDSETETPSRSWSEIRKKERENESELAKKKQEEGLRLSIATKELKLKHKYGPRPRKYSLQQAMLSIFSGGAMSLVLYNLLNTAASSGLLYNLEQVMVRNMEMPEITGWVPVFQMLWVIGLIPMAKGFAHLINGIFFAPKPEPMNVRTEAPAPGFVKERPDYITSGQATPTNEFERKPGAGYQSSVTEEPTMQFVPRNPATSDQ